ncbi:MAG: hypothetical protein KAR11_00075 [Phycisphaerae bacterium]|nr:hypothetical protein [Phycisphaerae bacterium]
MADSRREKFHLVIVMALVGLASIVLWEVAKTSQQNAYANQKELIVLDAGKQRRELITEQQNTNKKLDKLIKVMTSGDAKFMLVLNEKPKATKTRSGRVR